MNTENQIIRDTRPVMVSIRCITYNHEKYIRDALEGFVMQKTNFRFEAIVHDDASTDGTAAVIRDYAEKYPEIIKPIYETENQYSKHDGSLWRIMNYAMSPESKYVAFCEGDDYWTDPLKLQKQVDILEAHSEYGAVYTAFEAFDNATNEVRQLRFVPRSGWCYEAMLCDMLDIWTLTTCIRKDLILNRPDIPDSMEAFQGDIHLFLYATSISKVYCLNEKTARYRILENSASHFTDKKKAATFQYMCANTHLYHLQNGPKVSMGIKRIVMTYICTRRIKYAVLTNCTDIVKATTFPISLVKAPKQFAIFICCKILRYNPIMSLLHHYYKL